MEETVGREVVKEGGPHRCSMVWIVGKIVSSLSRCCNKWLWPEAPFFCPHKQVLYQPTSVRSPDKCHFALELLITLTVGKNKRYGVLFLSPRLPKNQQCKNNLRIMKDEGCPGQKSWLATSLATRYCTTSTSWSGGICGWIWHHTRECNGRRDIKYGRIHGEPPTVLL